MHVRQMMQFIPFFLAARLAATGLVPGLNKWHPDGIHMMRTWLRRGPGK